MQGGLGWVPRLVIASTRCLAQRIKLKVRALVRRPWG